MKQEIKFKQDYDRYETLIKRNEQIYFRVCHDIPQNFESLLNYVKNKKSKFVTIFDGITISLRIDKSSSLIIHKTLLESHVDISVCHNSTRFTNFMCLPLWIVYLIICQYN